MNYIQELRQLVGTRPLIMVGAAVLVLNSEDELLMLRRTDNACWGIPGGALEPGERLEETARRETREETGLVVGEMQLFNVFSGPDLYYRYPNGAEVHNVTAVYLTRDVHGAACLDLSEHSEIGYFPLEKLPEPVSPPILTILTSFRASPESSSNPLEEGKGEKWRFAYEQR
jgi:8-oxo-dGTP pyrophosphatase MutT (NUDIX family)